MVSSMDINTLSTLSISTSSMRMSNSSTLKMILPRYHLLWRAKRDAGHCQQLCRHSDGHHQCSRFCQRWDFWFLEESFSGNTMGFVAPQITGILIKVPKLKNLKQEALFFVKFKLKSCLSLNCKGPRWPGTLENPLLPRFSGRFSLFKLLKLEYAPRSMICSQVYDLWSQVYAVGNAVFVIFGTSQEQKWNRRQGSQYQWISNGLKY